MKKIGIWSVLMFITVSAAVFDGRIVKGADTGNGAISAGTTDELKALVKKEVEDRVASMNATLEQLETDLDTYEKYIENDEKMESFYSGMIEETKALCIAMREYGLAYAKLIFSDGYPREDRYDDLEDLYDDIYDDAGDDIYDGIYDELLDDVYDVFYDGVLDDAYDITIYKEWADARSDEYERWIDARSDVYDEWSDLRSDIYGFWSDMRSDAWDDDMEDAEEDMQDFQEDIDELKEEIGMDPAEGIANEIAAAETEEEGTEQGESEAAESAESGLRAEFTQAMDSYDAFIDEYCAFMKTYAESDGSDAELLAEYGNYMQKYAEAMEAFEAWNDNDMNEAETAYYLEVQSRTMSKLLEVLE